MARRTSTTTDSTGNPSDPDAPTVQEHAATEDAPTQDETGEGQPTSPVMEQAEREGLIGVKVDQTPNEAYTVQGVTAEPFGTPEAVEPGQGEENPQAQPGDPVEGTGEQTTSDGAPATDADGNPVPAEGDGTTTEGASA